MAGELEIKWKDQPSTIIWTMTDDKIDELHLITYKNEYDFYGTDIVELISNDDREDLESMVYTHLTQKQLDHKNCYGCPYC